MLDVVVVEVVVVLVVVVVVVVMGVSTSVVSALVITNGLMVVLISSVVFITSDGAIVVVEVRSTCTLIPSPVRLVICMVLFGEVTKFLVVVVIFVKTNYVTLSCRYHLRAI